MENSSRYLLPTRMWSPRGKYQSVTQQNTSELYDEVTSLKSPVCQPLSPANLSGWVELTKPLLIDGISYVRQFYTYEECLNGSTASIQVEIHKNIKCYCVRNPLSDCLAAFRMDEKNICRPIFVKIVAFQFFLLIVGIILNSIIICTFLGKRRNRAINSNIILFNQALVDIANCFIYILPNVTHLLYTIMYEKSIRNFEEFNISFIIMTSASSILIYLLMSIERYISIYKPLWHRANIRTDHLWKAVCGAWLLAIISSVVPICVYLYFTEYQRTRFYKSFYRYYQFVLSLVMLLLIATITVVFIATLVKAFRSKTMDRKKQIKLLSMLLIMFLLFLVTFAAIAVSGISSSNSSISKSRQLRSHYIARTQMAVTIFACTAVVDPTLTLYLKRDFRFRTPRVEPKPVI